MKILMVCLGNICRSPLAEGILKSKNKNLFVDSAGTADYHIGKPPDSRSIEIAKIHNIEISKQRARQFSYLDFQKFDIIYAMDKKNYAHLISLAKTKKDKEKVKLILSQLYPNKYKSVPDPYYGGNNGFIEVYNLLEKACEKISSKID